MWPIRPRSTQSATSRRCTIELRRLGHRVFRAHNSDVYENIDGVLDTLLALIEEEPLCGGR
jgi:very-short-patch-repair endonuclease